MKALEFFVSVPGKSAGCLFKTDHRIMKYINKYIKDITIEGLLKQLGAYEQFQFETYGGLKSEEDKVLISKERVENVEKEELEGLKQITNIIEQFDDVRFARRMCLLYADLLKKNDLWDSLIERLTKKHGAK